jgi:hypothetical protein
MKTFKQLIAEVAQPNNEDELNFKEKHSIEVIDHPVSKEHQHSAEKKSPKRRADYDAGEDEEVYEAKMDPVGQEDDDIDNDGDVDSSDEYLHARRKAIAKAMKKEAATSPYAIGMASAMKQTGDTPPLKKSTITKAHKIAKSIEKNESVQIDEMKQPFVVVDTADSNKVVAMASDEQGAKRSIASAERPPINVKDKSTLKIVKTRKKQSIGYPLNEETDLTENFKAGAVKLNDGSSVIVKDQEAKLLNQMFAELNADNKKRMLKVAMTNKSGFNEILGFAREAL